MVSKIFKQAAEFLNQRKHDRRWMMAFCCMAVLVAFGTVAALRMTGKALTNPDEVLNCPFLSHEHGEDCYDPEGALTCGLADYAVHTHTEDCHDPEGTLVCTLPEIEAHEHTEDCYEEREVLICEEEETEDTEGHTHTEDCYAIEMGVPGCGIEEHAHADECFESVFSCEEEEHTHGDGCYEEEEEGGQALACDQKEHEHGDGCSEKQQICGMEEHMHGEECRSAENVLICGKEEAEVREGHEHTENCYKTEEILACGKLELHIHGDSCFDEDGERICEIPVLEEHVHTKECFRAVEQTAVPAEEAEESPVMTKEFRQKYEDGILTVIASYEEDAGIPEEAELIVEPITEETDSDFYKEKTDTARELTGCQLPSAELLYQIGFYMDGEEIEPKGSVNIEVRIFRDGIESGDPVTVVHFGEEEPRILESTDIVEKEDGSLSTSFDSDAFSPFVILVGGEEEHRQTGYISGEQIVYTQADKTSDAFDLREYEEASEEMVCIEMQEMLEDAEGGIWYRYVPLTEDDQLQEQLTLYPCIPEENVTLEGNLTRRTLTAVDEEGIEVQIEGFLPEEAKLSVRRIYDPDIYDLMEEMKSYAEEFAPGDFRLVYEMDLGTTETLPEPVTISVRNFDFGYDEYDNLESWVYQMDTGEDAGVLRHEAGIGSETGITFETDHLSFFYLAAGITEGRDEYFRLLVDYGDIDVVELENAIMEDETESDEETMEPEYMALNSGTFSKARAADPPSTVQISGKGGNASKDEDGVKVSKKIEGTNLENVFDITLTVQTPTNSKEVYTDPDVAIVIVMDVSNTMKAELGNSTRYGEALNAARTFITNFRKQCGGNTSKSKIGFVSFNTDADLVFGLQSCTTEKQSNDLISTMNTKIENIMKSYGNTLVSTSPQRFTNIEGGLKRAYDMLRKSGNQNKYIILITDGFPTTYLIDNDLNSKNYNGYDPRNKDGNSENVDGVFYDRVTKKPCSDGASYSNKAAIRARNMAKKIKEDKINIFSIGVGIGDQTIQKYINDFKDHKTISVVDRGASIKKSSDFEIGTGEKDYEKWLRSTIGSGSGYYYDVSKSQQITKHFTDIWSKIVKKQESIEQKALKVEDPIPAVGNVRYVEFIGFYEKTGKTLQVNENGSSKNLTGSYASGGENTVSFGSNKITWTLNKSGYASSKSGTKTTYTYTLKYRVRLKNEVSGFKEGNVYLTNDTAKLTYRTDTTVNGKTTKSGNKNLNFPNPSVKGYLSELDFEKVDRQGNAVEGAEFTLTHDTANCKLCRGDGKKAVSFGPYKAVSGENGKVSFKNIPSGHQYTMKETKVPDGYEASGDTYTVKVAYDARTVTVVHPDGTTGAWEEKVVNKTRVGLPETGGPGLYVYIIPGILCMILGAGLLYRDKLRERRG